MPSSSPLPSKRLFVFCDGTGQDGLLSWEISEDKKNVVPPSEPLLSEKQYPSKSDRYASNVFRLSRCISQEADDGTPQIVLYQSGVGVPNDFEGDDSTALASATGKAVAAKIRDAYNFIVQNYASNDKIYLFGFSRGAYTARKLAGLLDQLGLLDKRQMSQFFEHWKHLLNGAQNPGKLGTPVDVQFLGVWDTVGYITERLGSTPLLNLLGFQDNSLPNCVLRARHALAYHEKRYEFLCTPFAPPTGEAKLERLVQVWFPGVHTDVGGGYEEHQIADLSLLWMAGELKKLDVKLDEEYLDTRLSSGKSLLEVHHERSWKPYKDGKRLKILNGMKGHSSTFYHRSLWGSFRHVDRNRQDDLNRLTEQLVLNPSKMVPLNQVEIDSWAPRWTRFRYIPDPTRDQGRDGRTHEPLPEHLPPPEHDAPVEEESPDVLFD
ncbi:hypothetical protein FRC07_010443 [Ceratobasidium sp. 392]|nr:hypothetical protein FRC07_010443 [Ceratobasidium sp. 392]